jgi:hypothetical protein
VAYDFSNSAVKTSFKAGADLSTAQYKFVKLNSDGDVILAAATTDRPIGVLQNDPASGETAEVTIAGGTKVKAGGSVAVGNPLFTNATALGVTSTVGSSAATFYILGTVISAGASGEVVTAVIDCANSARGQ